MAAWIGAVSIKSHRESIWTGTVTRSALQGWNLTINAIGSKWTSAVHTCKVARLTASTSTREEEISIAHAATIKLFGRVRLARDATVVFSIGTGFTGWMASHAVTIAAHECTLAAEARSDVTAVKECLVFAACAVS